MALGGNKLRDTWSLMRKKKHCYVFLAPFMIIFILFMVVPVGAALVLGFFHYSMLQAPVFNGVTNYINMLFFDDVFRKAFMNTLTIAIVVGPVGFLGSMIFAWMLNEMTRTWRVIFVLLLYAPNISLIAYLVWVYILSGDQYGYINSFLLSFGLVQQPVQFTTDPAYMMAFAILFSCWASLGANFLGFVAGLQGIDKSLYEAASVDGVRNRWQELWYITLPSVKPQLLFGSLIAITYAFNIGPLTQNLFGNPSTDYTVYTVINQINDYAMYRFDMGYACALATVLFIVMVGVNQLMQVVLRKVGS